MNGNDKKRNGYEFVFGIAIGILVYKIIVDVLWPMITG